MAKESYRTWVHTNFFGVDFDQVFDETWIYYITARDYNIPLAYCDDVESLDEAIRMAEAQLKVYLLIDYESSDELRTPALKSMLESALYEEREDEEAGEECDGWGYIPDASSSGE